MQNILLALIGGLLAMQLFETLDKNGHEGGDMFTVVIYAIIAGAVMYGIGYGINHFVILSGLSL